MGLFSWVKKIPIKKVLKIGDAVTESPLKDVVPVIGKIDGVKDAVKGIVSDLPASLEALSDELRQWPEDRLNAWLVRLGHAFGPQGILHFSQLSLAAQEDLLRRVPILKTNHTDWSVFKWVPRRTVCWVGGEPYSRAQVIEGHITDASVLPNGELLPIPADGDWYVVQGYLAATTGDGVHDRLGWRWDTIDRYWDLSLALKKVR